MKKHLVIILFLTAIFSFGHAQIYLGPQLGLNLSGLTGNLGFKSGDYGNPFEMSNFTRIMLGANLNFPWKEHVQISPSLNLSFEGAKFEAASPNEYREYYLTYLNLPMVLNIGIFDESVSYYGIIGPYVGYLLGGRGKRGGFGYSSVMDLPIKNFFDDNNILQPHPDIDAGIVLGAGGMWAIGNGQFIAEARFQRGFVPVAKDDTKTQYYKSLGANSVFNILLGYRVDISGWFSK